MRATMTHNQLELSELTTKQIKELLWVLKGTSQAQPLYRELSSRTTQTSISPDDSDWQAKVDEVLMDKTGLTPFSRK